MDTTTNTFRGDFVIVHENGHGKELLKLPEGSSVYPTKMHEELEKLSARLEALEQKYYHLQAYVQGDMDALFVDRVARKQSMR